MKPTRKRIPYEQRDQNHIALNDMGYGMLAFLGGCIVPIFGFIGLAAGEIVAIWWPIAAAIVLAITLAVVCVYVTMIGSQLWDEKNLYMASYVKLVWAILTGFIISTIVFIGVFAEFIRHFYIAFGGFSAPNQSVLTWAEFAIQEWIDTATIGISSIYGGISHVEASTWWSKTFIIVPYHLYCAAFLFIIIKNGISLSRAEARDEILGTIRGD